MKDELVSVRKQTMRLTKQPALYAETQRLLKRIESVT